MIDIAHGARLDIGSDVIIQPLASIYCKLWIEIESGCRIANGVMIVDHDHRTDEFESIGQTGTMADIHIGKRCWIGANAVILKGVTLGDDTIVGAGAIVTHSFPEGKCVLAGNPAKIIKQR